MYKKITVSFFAIIIGLPTMAFFDAKVSKTQFYDNSSTIMREENKTNNVVRSLDYWSVNALHPNKYRPYYMISNKDLYKIFAKNNRYEAYQKSQIPGVYNISLKTSSIVNVSLNSPNRNVSYIRENKISDSTQVQNENSKNTIYTNMYESVKAEGTEVSDILNACVSLKNSNIPENYDRALDLLNRITNKEPYNAYAYFLKGEVYALKNDSQSAMQNYVESIRINPMNKACYKSIAKILEPTNKVLAQKYYQKALN